MAGTGLKAIETVYNGYRFRSRLEARWAVFLDTLGVRYEYEPEGFDLDGLYYLPDFWLPKHQCWFEIKGDLDHDSRIKAERLAVASGFSVLLAGACEPVRIGNRGAELGNVYNSILNFDPDGSMDGCKEWGECRCGRFGVGHFGAHTEHESWFGGAVSEACEWPGPAPTPRLAAAYLAARQARFEHGEVPLSPAPPATRRHPSVSPAAYRLARFLHTQPAERRGGARCMSTTLQTMSDGAALGPLLVRRALLELNRLDKVDWSEHADAGGPVVYDLVFAFPEWE